jgi:hypothetical protein
MITTIKVRSALKRTKIQASLRGLKFIAIASILPLLLILPDPASAQWNWYGQIGYVTDSTLLTTGCITKNYQGLISGGVRVMRQTLITNTSPDFAIIKTDGWGGFSMAPNDWVNYYQIIDNCTSNAYNCVGLRVIEINDKGNGEAYALAGIYNKGVFFATLDALGNVINTIKWDFPTPLTTQKVFITPASDGDNYYITGDYLSNGYVIKVTFNCVTTFANFYWATSGGYRIEPRAVIEANANPNEIVVVGNCEPDAQACPLNYGTDGMFMRLDKWGNFLALNAYNLGPAGYDTDDDIHCIKYAAQSGGYIIGGRSYGPLTAQTLACCTTGCARPFNPRYPLWMALLDYNGNVMWSKLIQPTVLPSLAFWNGVTDVTERFNNNSGQYEYYGVYNAQVVFKLDQNGNNTFTPDEFTHGGSNAPMGGNPWGISAMDIINTPPTDEGLITFSPRHEVAKSYFNGVTGCGKTNQIPAIYQGPTLRANGTVASSGMLTSCISFNVTSITLTPGVNCQASSVTGGSNLRTAAATGVNEKESRGIHVFPNPVVNTLNISWAETTDKKVTITLYDATGKLAFRTESESADASYTVDFTKLNLKSGVYLLKASSSNASVSHRIIYDTK